MPGTAPSQHIQARILGTDSPRYSSWDPDPILPSPPAPPPQANHQVLQFLDVHSLLVPTAPPAPVTSRKQQPPVHGHTPSNTPQSTVSSVSLTVSHLNSKPLRGGHSAIQIWAAVLTSRIRSEPVSLSGALQFPETPAPRTSLCRASLPAGLGTHLAS